MTPATADALSPQSLSRFTELTHPSRPWIVLNPRSFRASIGSLADDARSLARTAGAHIIEASDPAHFALALDRAIEAGSGPLVVLAGDGTVQAIADHLARLPDPLHRPALLVLAGGRTNLIAADLGGRGDVLRKITAHLQRMSAGVNVRLQERRTLVVEQSHAPARHGFFFAGAQVDSAIRACHAHREAGRTMWHTGHLSNPFCLFKLGIAKAVGCSRLPDKPDLRIAAHGLGQLSGPTRLFAASTLSYSKGLLNPFAERGHGALRVTAVRGDATRFWRQLPRVLAGRFTAQMCPEAGYLSGRCEQLEIIGIARYTLDGEKFECDPSRPLILRTGPTLHFVMP